MDYRAYMRHMGRLLPLFVLTLLIPSYALVAVADSGRAVNVDLDITDISITYPDNAKPITLPDVFFQLPNSRIRQA